MAASKLINYVSATCYILTKHKKENILAPLLLSELSLELKHTDEFDTDELGTFCGSNERKTSPLETAKFKAKKAIELTGADIGIGSEGSFSHDPITGLLPWTEEIIYWYDQSNGIELTGLFSGPSFHDIKTCHSIDDIKSWSADFNFKDQAVMLIDRTTLEPTVKKGIVCNTALIEAAEERFHDNQGAPIDICFDLRAHHSKKRRHHISLALQDLLVKLKSYCPSCFTPGFSVSKKEPGLPCRDCNSPTNELLNTYYSCQKCQFYETKRVDKLVAEPINCPNCNP